MKLENKSPNAFEVTFNGATFDIPVGVFDVQDDTLGAHILDQSKKWDKNVIQVSAEVKEQIVKEETPKKEAPAKKTAGATSDSLPKSK